MSQYVLLNQLKDYYAKHKEIPSTSAMALLCSKPIEQIQSWLSLLVSSNLLLPPVASNTSYRPTPDFLKLTIASNTIPAGTPSYSSLEALDDGIDIQSYLVKKNQKEH